VKVDQYATSYTDYTATVNGISYLIHGFEPTATGYKNYMQLNKSKNSGIVITNSPGKIIAIDVTLKSGSACTFTVFGRNTPYTSASEWTDESTLGDKFENNNITKDNLSLSVSAIGDYKYIALKYDDGSAGYIASITFTYVVDTNQGEGTKEQCKKPTFETEADEELYVGDFVKLACGTTEATIKYTVNDGAEQTYDAEKGIELTSAGTWAITAWAVKDGYENSATDSRTYTVKEVETPDPTEPETPTEPDTPDTPELPLSGTASIDFTAGQSSFSGDDDVFTFDGGGVLSSDYGTETDKTLYALSSQMLEISAKDHTKAISRIELSSYQVKYEYSVNNFSTVFTQLPSESVIDVEKTVKETMQTETDSEDNTPGTFSLSDGKLVWQADKKLIHDFMINLGENDSNVLLDNLNISWDWVYPSFDYDPSNKSMSLYVKNGHKLSYRVITNKSSQAMRRIADVSEWTEVTGDVDGFIVVEKSNKQGYDSYLFDNDQLSVGQTVICKIVNGPYTVDNINWTKSTTGITTGVGFVESDERMAEPEYYTIQGVKVSGENLSRGVYIRRQGTSVQKFIVR
jgi:hypothetical protein